MLDVKQYDNYGNFTKNYLNNKTTTNKSISLQSSPLKSNSPNYSRSTNSTPKHYFKNNQTNQLNCIDKKSSYNNYLDQNDDTNLDDYLEYDNSSNSLEDLNCLDLNNQNSSNEEYDNSEESPINDKFTAKFNKHNLKSNNNFLSNNQTYIKHSKSYQNQFFDIPDSPTSKLNLLDKPTSLSLSGNNFKNLNKSQQQSSSPKTKKFETFIMTGEHIISLSKSNSDENPMILADIANFKNDNSKNQKQKLRQKLGEKKLINNSDQMRECLSPELKSTELNKLDLVNNSINDLLTNNFTNDDENLIVSLDKMNEDNLENNKNEILDCKSILNEEEIDKNVTHIEQNKIESNDNQNEIISNNQIEIELNNNETEIELNNKQNEIKSNNKQNELKSNENNEISNEKRYPTFIQQQIENEINNQINSNIINEQSLNLNHQKSIDESCAKRLAKRLYNLDKFKKADVSRHLCKNNDFSKTIATEYCNFFDFNNMSLIDSLRLFFSKLYLNGNETQERERILLFFSRRYFTCNPSLFNTVDSVFSLVCSLVMLSQNLHGDCVSKKITLNDYIENLKLLNDGQNYPKDLLKKFYNEIKNDKLECLIDDDDQNKDDKMCNGTTLGNASLDTLPNLNSSEYKKGYLMRKCCIQPNGKKFLLGKRKWKSFFAVLRDTVLYLHKDDKSQICSEVKNSIRIHHAVAYLASDYKKRKWVFRLITADGAEYMISVNTKNELESWMDTINFVAATISAPPINCASIGSSNTNKKKKYPLKSILPTCSTKYQFKEQLLDHESRRIRLNDDIQDITQSLRSNNNLVCKTTKNAVIQLRYLKNEHERYTTYCKVMKKVKINGNGILEKANKSLQKSSKPLTTLTIDEESSIRNLEEDDEDDDDELI